MMMPIVDPSPVHHHHHGHGHQTFYHSPSLVDAEQTTGKMQLTLILPNGVPSVINVDANTPMMDLLVQAASSNKLNPSNYSLVVLDSNQHVIHFKPNQTVGQIVENCHLPQMNGSSTISLLPKDTSTSVPSPKSKTQPFEITVRLQVNLPDAQKILLRVDPNLPLYEIKEQICKQKKYVDSSRYTLRLPKQPERTLLLGLSLAEYKTNQLTLVRLKEDLKLSSNPIQSFDRLYRSRSESQPPQETMPETSNDQQRPASVHLNPPRSPSQGANVTSLPAQAAPRPITSHTSLHAYWNDPNFDTQSQISNCSSTTKKRRAPRAPGQLSPNPLDPPNELQSDSQHQSQESLTENNQSSKQKRKAPVPPPHSSLPTDQIEQNTNETITEEQQTESVDTPTIQINTETKKKIEITMDPTDEQRLVDLLAEQRTPPQARLVITTASPEQDSHPSTPIYSQIQKNKEIVQIESPYSTVKLTPTPSPTVQSEVEERIPSPPPPPAVIYSVKEIAQAGIAEKPTKSSKKSTSTDGLVKIINDHQERAQIYQTDGKSAEEVTYFRVARSRHGKFETDDRGFVATMAGVFDKNEKTEKATTLVKSSETVTQSSAAPVKSLPVTVQNQSKGKQAYDLLKKYEKEDEEHQQGPLTVDTEYLKTSLPAVKETSPTPIQLEVTERTTHISVTVESDRKQLITRASPIPPATSAGAAGPPPIVAPKPFGKTITEYRTVRRLGNDGEMKTTTTVRTENVPSTETETKRASSEEKTPHESLMESIRQIGGSQNLQQD